MSFYEVYAEAKRVREIMGIRGFNDSYKIMKYLTEYWVRNPWRQ